MKQASAPISRRLTRGQQARLRNLRVLNPSATLPGDWVTEWNQIASDLAATQERLETDAKDDGEQAAEALRRITGDPRFLEAVACSSPGVYQDLKRRHVDSARMRRQIAAYCQRLATKCETMSFFGPINYASVDLAYADNGSASWPGFTVSGGRRAYVSAWSWDRLQAAVLADQQQVMLLVPRRRTFARTPAAAGDNPVLRALMAADGRRTVRELVAAAQVEASREQVAAALADGLSRGILACDLLPDSTEPDPVRCLIERLPDDSAAGALARQAARMLDRYPHADPDEKTAIQLELTALTPPPDTGVGDRGKFYNDRVVIHEAAAGTLAMTIGGELAADLNHAVPDMLGLLAHAAMRTRSRANEFVARTLGAGRFPMTKAIRLCRDAVVPADSWLPESIEAVLAEVPAQDTPEIDLAEYLPAPPAPRLPILASVDVMIAADSLASYRSGHTPLIVSDIHDAALLTPWALQFHPDARGVLSHRDAEIRRVLGQHRAVSVVARRTSGLPPLRFPGPLLELGAVSGSGERVLLDRLYVESDGEQARLRSADHSDQEIYFHNGELDSAFHTAFALPRLRPPALPDRERLPRLRWRQVVFSRRRWKLDPLALMACSRPESAVKRLSLVRDLANERGWPLAFFAKSPHERKPVYVDLAAPLLVDGLLRLARGAERLYASELLPGPDQLWLHDGDLKFGAELRCVYLRAGEDGAEP